MPKFAGLLLCLLLVLPALAQDEPPVGERARSESYPVSIALPQGWESFQGDPKVPGEVLFLQSPEEGPLNATLTLSAFPMPQTWDDLLRRQTYELVVELDAPVLSEGALTLRGAKGHKWVFKAPSSSGREMVYYRLYLAMPAGMAGNRLLVMAGSAPSEQADEAMQLFNTLARSLTWGAQSADLP